MADVQARVRGVVVAAMFVALSISDAGVAGPLPRENTPEPLKPWLPWVVHGAEEKLCPYTYNNGELRQCSWPSRLTLTLGTKGGAFTHQVLAFRTLWMPLPGDGKRWPVDVKLDGKPAPVVAQNLLPGVVVTAGAHTLSGAFSWTDLPENLPLPAVVGLVDLSLNGARVAVPNVDAEGRLWLRQPSGGAKPASIDVRVHRLVSDDVPMRVTTQFEISASGRSQEVVLPNALLPGFIPLSMSSELPARVEADGKLRVQLRQGRWQLALAGRNMAPQKALVLPEVRDPLAPAEEAWAFDAHSDLRIVTVEGAQAIDPQQTTLPQEWKRFPAYRVQPGQTLRFVETRRGDPESTPDKLALQRILWLDFDGRGFTIQDQIKGAVTRAWRLEMAKPQALGRVAVNGEDQYITQLAADANPGIELRQGRADISADSRLETGARTFSATGWRQDFDQVSARLELPPGWKLLHASGVDRAPESWIERWTLLDLFLVLVAALACGKLFGWPWALIALTALALSYHEPDAPQWAWLSLLAAIALVRVLPDGHMRRTFSVYKWLSAAALVILLVPFAVAQIRQMIYPVLEQPYNTITQAGSTMELRDGFLAQRAAPEDIAERPAPAAPASRSKLASSSAPLEKKAKLFSEIDPNAKVQTGPGLPAWHWNDYALTWSGPVQQEQQVNLWLLSPPANAALTVARLALMFVLFACLAGVRLPRVPGWPGRAAVLVLSALALVAADAPRVHAADIPTQKILDELRDKLFAPADCLPGCADIARMKLTASSDALQIRLEVHADIDTSLPLPGGANQWLPDRVSVDGKPAAGLARDKSGALWLQIARGVHQVTLESPLAGRDTIRIALPLRPRHVEVVAEGWTVEGLGTNGEPGESLQLLRAERPRGGRETVSGGQLPPFVRVERTLALGLTWHVTTNVLRAGPSTAPVLVQVPLLAGESITTADVPVQRGAAVVNLGPQTNAVAFESNLAENAQIVLKAPTATNQIQVWRLNLGPQWHATLAGIPVIHHQDNEQRWFPEWRPWPGEEASLALTRPAGVEGQTLTLDRSLLHLRPGIRATDARLTLSLRSSRGGQHSVVLPEGSALQSVAIDGVTQPIRLEEAILKLPIGPGKQEIVVDWREPRGMSTSFHSSSVDAGLPGVNGTVHIVMPRDRWTLFLGGPRIGPAILFWGVVVALGLIALALGRIALTPLKWRHWFLLGLGLTQAPMGMSAIVVAWLLVLGLRKKFRDDYTSNRFFNFGQVILVLWTVAALVSLFWAVQQGLLGTPEMQIVGNGSDSSNLNWYQDRTSPQLPSASVISVPLLAYKALMLAWALWLAYALLKWLQWGWTCFSDGGYWRKLKLWEKKESQAS